MRAIVVFDGDCGLCNGFVAWLVRRDRDARFGIAGSAGAVGARVLELAGLETHVADSSIVVWDGTTGLLRSDALVAIARGLPWPWRSLAAIRVAPRAVRDRIYDAVARRRPRRPAADPACGTPPAALAATWKERLATPDDVASLSRG